MTDKNTVTPKGERQAPFIPPNAMHIYTDGSFRPPDNASFAFLIFSERTKHVIRMERHAARGATINQMELMAINRALDHPNMDYAVIYTDSMYCISCLTQWRKTWAKNNWITPLGQPVKNKELIIEIARKIDSKKFVRFIKVQAHSGDPFNSLVDFLAQNLSLKMRDNPQLPNGHHPI